MVLGNLIGGFIVILIGTTLMPTVANEVQGSRFFTNGSGVEFTTNVTGAASTVTSLVTLFFALGVMAAGVALAVSGLKEAGMF